MPGLKQLGGLKLPADKRVLVIAAGAAAVVFLGPKLLKPQPGAAAAAGAGVSIDQLLGAMAQASSSSAGVAVAASSTGASLGLAGLQAGVQLGLGGQQLAGTAVDALARSTDVLGSSLANVASRAVDALAGPRSPVIINSQPVEVRPLPSLIPPPSVTPGGSPIQVIPPVTQPLTGAPPIYRPDAPSAAAYYRSDADMAAAVRAQAPVQLAGTQIKLVTGEWVTL